MTLNSRQSVAAAWAVHSFTLTGAIWACLAIVALIQGDIKMMWLWLGIALVVDGVDGSLARKANVQLYASQIDGAILDNIVDYLTWTFIPALFAYLYLPLGPHWISLLMLVTICVSSLFCYANTRLKTSDYYFMGFPAAWNIVAMAMWILGTGAYVNVAVIILLSLLTVSPLTFVHPLRVKTFGSANLVASAAWIGSSVVLVAALPTRHFLAAAIWWVAGVWILGVSLLRTIREIQRHRSQAGSVSVADEVPTG